MPAFTRSRKKTALLRAAAANQKTAKCFLMACTRAAFKFPQNHLVCSLSWLFVCLFANLNRRTRKVHQVFTSASGKHRQKSSSLLCLYCQQRLPSLRSLLNFFKASELRIPFLLSFCFILPGKYANTADI